MADGGWLSPDGPLGLVARSADPVEFWFFTLAVSVLAAGGFVFAFRWFQRARVIEDMPTSRLRSAHQGYVQLEGRCEPMPGPAISGPLTGLPCAWWSYEITRQGDRTATGSRWHVVEKGRSDALFYLVDDTGRCIVDPDGAQVRAAARDTWRGDRVAQNGLLQGHRLRRDGRRYRYTEQRLTPGDPLYAIGYFKTHSHAAHWDVGEETRALLARWKGNRDSLVARFDANDDGEIDLREWQAVRRAARTEVLTERREHLATPGVHVLARPPDGRLFLLAAQSQAALARRYRLRMAGGLAAFFLLGTAAALAIAARLV